MLTIVNLVLSIWNTILRGLVLKIFWAWFIVSQFEVVPPISVLGAIGLSYLVALFATPKLATQEEWDRVLEGKAKPTNQALALFNGFTYSLGLVVFLGVGWVIHYFM
jgi:hypothetical protein